MSNLQYMHGLYVGQLDDEELREFERAVEDGRARRGYVGVGGFMGLAKVVVNSDEHSVRGSSS